MNTVLGNWSPAAEHWGLDARLMRLDGEYDLNFLVRSHQRAGLHVLKVMRAGCGRGIGRSADQGAGAHLQRSSAGPALSKAVLSRFERR